MKLAETIAAQNITAAELGRRVGITRVHASDIVRGDARPSTDLAARISKAIGGAVCALHLLYPDGIPDGFGGERACRCQGAASPDTTAHESQCPQDGPNAPGTDADTTADGGQGHQVQREGVTHDEDDTATPAAGDRRAA